MGNKLPINIEWEINSQKTLLREKIRKSFVSSGILIVYGDEMSE